MISKSVKVKILSTLFKRFRIDPLLFAYKRLGILNWEDDNLSGENFFVTQVLYNKLPQNKNLVFFDIGANVGRYSEMLLHTFPKAEVHAFEPLPSCLPKLQSLKETCKGRIIVNSVCVSDEEATFSINTYAGDPESEHASLYAAVLTDIHKSNHIQQIHVAATTIDNYCEDFKIKTIDLLKIDTEGHEYKVLSGARNLLKENTIAIIQFEFNEMNVISRTYFKDFYDLLKPNYNLYRLNTNCLIPIGDYDTFLEIFKFQNFIAVNKLIDR